VIQKKFEVTKVVIRSRKAKRTDNTMDKRKRRKNKQWSTNTLVVLYQLMFSDFCLIFNFVLWI